MKDWKTLSKDELIKRWDEEIDRREIGERYNEDLREQAKQNLKSEKHKINICPEVLRDRLEVYFKSCTFVNRMRNFGELEKKAIIDSHQRIIKCLDPIPDEGREERRIQVEVTALELEEYLRSGKMIGRLTEGHVDRYKACGILD